MIYFTIILFLVFLMIITWQEEMVNNFFEGINKTQKLYKLYIPLKIIALIPILPMIIIMLFFSFQLIVLSFDNFIYEITYFPK